MDTQESVLPVGGRTVETPLIRIRDVEKSFGGVKALTGVNTDIRPGVVHGFVGANGAGKSTLIRCLAGVSPPDRGTIEVDGSVVAIDSPQVATDLRLAFIHQETSLIAGWDAMRNMALGSRPTTRAGIIDWRTTHQRATHIAEMLGMEFPLSTRADRLSAADQSRVLIGRALMLDARMIAMDEPTASLSAAETEHLHRLIRDLTARNIGVIFVSHRLDEVSELCRDITVFKDGAVTKRVTDEPVSKRDLVGAIVGRDLEIRDHGRPPKAHGTAVLEVRDLHDGVAVHGANLEVAAGEVVGLGGLVGAGRTELASLIYGARSRTRGDVRLNGRSVRFRTPAHAVRAGIGLLPEERRSEALFLDKSIDFNINVASLSSMTFGRGVPLLRLGEGRRRAADLAKAVTVKATGVGDIVGHLSGGNQQKVALARWLVRAPALLILDEPSRGVDVGARAELHAVIRQLARDGAAILAISSDNEELVDLCDRVAVMAGGRVTGEVQGEHLTVENLLHLSFEHSRAKETTS